jgi:hypothetical protein
MDKEYIKQKALKLLHTGAIRALLPVIVFLVFDGKCASYTWWWGVTCALTGIVAYYGYRAAKRARLQLANVIWMLLFCVGGYLTGIRWLPVVGIIVFHAIVELDWPEKLRPAVLSVLLPSICGWWAALFCALGYIPIFRYMETTSRWQAFIAVFLIFSTYVALAIFRIKRLLLLPLMAIAGWLLF